MTNSPFEVPSEVRDFAERSVEQARKARESFIAAARRAAGAPNANPTAKSVGAHVLAYTEQNANAAFDLANRLVKAKDPQEAFAHQSEYLKAQFAALQTQAKELGVTLQKSVAPS